jgi:hypothetical protein
MVQDFYGRFGFRRDAVDETTGSTTWVLEVDAYQPKATFLDEVTA